MSSSNPDSRSCRWCGSRYSIDPAESSFQVKLGVPPPTLCIDCRQQLRAAQANQIHLFRTTCAGTGKQIICCFAPEDRYKVCEQEYWYSDAVDNIASGREIDWDRSFFDQLHDLQQAVLLPALFTDFTHDENSAYTNFAGRNRDCYLIFDSDDNWGCYYGYSVNSSKNSLECYRVERVELCCEIVDSRQCYNSAYIYNSENCSDSMFLNNCIGCQNCLFCSNLVHKQFHVMNQPVSPERFAEMRRSFSSHIGLTEAKANFRTFAEKFPQKALRGFQNENVSGNYLMNCRNAEFSFDCRESWDVRNCFQAFLPLKDCQEVDQCGEGELLYECSNLGYNAFNVKFSFASLNQLRDLTYCQYCFNGCADLFGCIGLKKKQYCILNKQYSKQEYFRLQARLIEKMKDDGDWGEKFPPFCLTTPYNLSVAQMLYPLEKNEALSLGFRWHDSKDSGQKRTTGTLPDRIEDTHDGITKEIFCCERCQKDYKIISQELEFCRGFPLALPRMCFFCRHAERLAGRCPRRLWSRKCDKCAEAIEAAYDPTRGQIVYCEKCYLDSLG